MRRTLRLVLALLVFAAPLAAQVVSGSVVLADGMTTVPGAIVVATNASGVTVGRALTTGRGSFVIALAGPATVSLTVLRIGYRPSAGPTVEVGAGATVNARIVFTARAITLTAVNVRERETCRVQGDSSLAVAQVWEEARKAMLTTQLSNEGPVLTADWIEYDRTLDTTSRLVQQQRVRSAQHPTTHAFRSQPADVLASAGYVVADSGGTTYYAPDADALLSEAFVNSHCFRLAAPQRDGDDRLIGVAFVPARDHRDARDIEGTLWLDRASAELRFLEYRYTNLPDVAAAAQAGGRVEFLRLAEGQWLVNRWYIRMPQLAMRDRSSEAGQRRLVMARTRQVLRAVRITGGEVLRATRRDSVLYRAVGATVSVHLVSRDSLVRSSGATVELDGTDYSARADGLGRASMTPVLPGRYRLRAHTALMDSVGMPAVEREVEARIGAAVDTLVLPGAEDVLARACPRDSIQGGEGMLHGRVLDERARAVGDAAVTAIWKGNFSIVATGDGDHLSYAQKTLGALTDAGGYWRLCGVPRNTLLTVRVAGDSGSDNRDARLNDVPFAAVDLVVHRQSAATRELSIATRLSQRPSALVELSVTDTRGAPLAGASLEVLPAGAASRTLVTGPTGRALLPDVAPGVLTVRARHVGFTPGVVAATVAAGRNTLPIVLSASAAPMLDTMRVVGDRMGGLRRNDEFEQRRQQHLAAVSFTREDIVKRNPVDIWQMLRGVPSLDVREMGGIMVVVSTRAFVAGLNDTPCVMTLMVDGIVQQARDVRLLPVPDEIHGVEVFAGAATIPLQYSGIGAGKMCGMVAVWTR